MPPCARFDEPLSKASFEIKRTSNLEEIWIAAARPAAPVPMINASVECLIVKKKVTVNKMLSSFLIGGNFIGSRNVGTGRHCA